jgi:nicotinamidase-related amidase
MSVQRTKPSATALVVVDIPQKLVPTMTDERMADVERAARILLGAAAELGAPVLYTEQYPKGLGPTIDPIAGTLGDVGAKRVEKVTFSACKEPTFVHELKETGADAAVVIGMETHICVFQTVRDLCDLGMRVDVPIDGVCSRRDDHRQIGLDLCTAAGATLTTAETILFDWMVQAGTDTFKKLSKLVR